MSSEQDQSAAGREPVGNWNLAEDPATSQCPFHAASKLHEGPDIFFNTDSTAFSGGQWIVTRYELQREILQDPETFSSEGIAGFSRMFGETWPLIPLELDPPVHMAYRMLLNPVFSPARINGLEAGIRQQAVSLIEAVRADGGCEFMEAFGRPFPVGVFMRLMGLPLEEMQTFLAWEDGLLHSPDIANRIAAAGDIKNYLVDLIAARRVKPTDDLVSFALGLSIEGKPISDDAVLGICYLLFVGGLDTVAATLGFTFRALAQQPDLQRQLRADKSLTPDAVEETLRAHGVVTTSRFVTRDVEFHGVTMRKGDRVSIALGLASRDSHEYTDPHKIDFRRANNRSISFSVGAHRCIGSHLARREFKIALDEWMDRTPEFRVAPGKPPEVHAMGVWGVERLHLVW